jgi:hypothetical protein
MASEEINVVHPSFIVEVIMPQKIRLVARNGRYSLISALNMSPNTNPIVAI